MSFFGVGNPFSTPVGQKIGKYKNLSLCKTTRIYVISRTRQAPFFFVAHNKISEFLFVMVSRLSYATFAY